MNRLVNRYEEKYKDEIIDDIISTHIGIGLFVNYSETKVKLPDFTASYVVWQITINNVKYEILWASWMIKYSDFQFSWIENLKEWDEIEEFEIFWTLKTTAYAFNKEVVMNKLRNIIKEWLLTNVESIFSIDESSFAIVNEIWREENPFRIKATAQVRVWYIQNFLSEKNNFVEKLKHQIAWLPIEEAEKILINTWKVSNVNIEVRPFFIKNISKIVDNIKFEIK